MNSGVAALKRPANTLDTRVSAQANNVKGMTLVISPTKAACHHTAPNRGSRLRCAAITNTTATAPKNTLPRVICNGTKESSAILMRKKLDPHTPARAHQ